MGLTQIATSGGMLLGTLLAGWLVDSSAGLPFLAVGIANLAAVVLAVRLLGPLAARQQHPETSPATSDLA